MPLSETPRLANSAENTLRPRRGNCDLPGGLSWKSTRSGRLAIRHAVCASHGMPRRRMAGCGGFVFHAMNRSAKQLTLFDGAADYQLFFQVLKEAQHKCPIRLLEYCLMPNHFHLLLWPEADKQLSSYMRWVAGVHAQRWRRSRGTIGKGAVYQGRFKWVAVQDARHYGIARRYIWQNPVRARLVEQPQQWPWSSASDILLPVRPHLADGPLLDEQSRAAAIAQTLPTADEAEMRDALRRNQPFGTPSWSHTLALRSWLIDVLERQSAAQAPGPTENSNKIDSLRR